jgi:hypothetical protein
MPQPALHVLLADRTLERWRRSASTAPFRLDADGAANAFRHGALAPDIGFFPGADAVISERAHTVRTGATPRRLLDVARTEAERAYAWGWVTHVLADVEIHPLVNAEAAAVLAEAGPPIAARQLAHVRVEVGLDARYLARTPGLRGRRLMHAFDARSIGRLAGTLRSTLDVDATDRRLLAMHRNVTRFFRAYLYLLDLIVAEQHAQRRAFRLTHVRALGGRLLRTDVPARGFLAPIMPSADFAARVDAAIDRFDAALHDHVCTGMAGLPDYDLERGGLLADAAAAPAVPPDGAMVAAA